MSIRAIFVPLATLLVVAALSGLWIWQCTGPHPVVSDVYLIEPQQAGQPYTVVGSLDNDRWSHGTVTLLFEIRNRQTGEVYREQRQVEILENDGALRVSAEISAPDGDYEPRIEALYPPEG